MWMHCQMTIQDICLHLLDGIGLGEGSFLFPCCRRNHNCLMCCSPVRCRGMAREGRPRRIRYWDMEGGSVSVTRILGLTRRSTIRLVEQQQGRQEQQQGRQEERAAFWVGQEKGREGEGDVLLQELWRTLERAAVIMSSNEADSMHRIWTTRLRHRGSSDDNATARRLMLPPSEMPTIRRHRHRDRDSPGARKTRMCSCVPIATRSWVSKWTILLRRRLVKSGLVNVVTYVVPLCLSSEHPANSRHSATVVSALTPSATSRSQAPSAPERA